MLVKAWAIMSFSPQDFWFLKVSESLNLFGLAVNLLCVGHENSLHSPGSLRFEDKWKVQDQRGRGCLCTGQTSLTVCTCWTFRRLWWLLCLKLQSSFRELLFTICDVWSDTTRWRQSVSFQLSAAFHQQTLYTGTPRALKHSNRNGVCVKSGSEALEYV